MLAVQQLRLTDTRHTITDVVLSIACDLLQLVGLASSTMSRATTSDGLVCSYVDVKSQSHLEGEC